MQMFAMTLPLVLKNWNTCKNKFTKHLQDLVGSPYILISYYMLHLQNKVHKIQR